VEEVPGREGGYVSKVRIKVEAHFGRTTKVPGTVTIDRASRTISVRPKFGREDFTLHLDDVADMVALKILQTKGLEMRATQTKKRRRRLVSRGLLTTGR
jgi:hypothetical protein